MPLPVEKSAGKVSSLVARWQTAADKEVESAARRESMSNSRRSSSVHSSARPSPRLSEDKPLPEAGAGTADSGEDGPMEVLDDFDEKLKIRDEVKVSEEKKEKPDEGSAVTKEEQTADIAVDTGDHAGTAPGTDEAKQGDTISPPPPPTAAAPLEPSAGTNTKSKAPTATAATEPRTNGPNKQSITAPLKPAAAKAPIKSGLPSARKASATTAPVTKTPASSIGPSKLPAAKPTATSTSTSSTIKTTAAGGQTKHRSTSVSTKPPSSTSSIRKPTLTSTATSTVTRSAPPPVSAKPAGTKPTAFTSRVPPSAFFGSKINKPSAATTSTTTTRRPSSAAAASKPGAPPVTAPLRPQVTGAPFKPTASSLAKAREASEKRQSMSLGRTPAPRASVGSKVTLSGHGKSASTPATSSTKPAPPKIAPPSTSGSRLLQGTASSRAKAAAAAAASTADVKTPRSPGSLTARVSLAKQQSSTSSPKSVRAPAPQSPATVTAKTPATPRSPTTSKSASNQPGSPLSAKTGTPRSPVTKASGTPRAPVTAKSIEKPRTPLTPKSQTPHSPATKGPGTPRSPITSRSTGKPQPPTTPKSAIANGHSTRAAVDDTSISPATSNAKRSPLITEQAAGPDASASGDDANGDGIHTQPDSPSRSKAGNESTEDASASKVYINGTDDEATKSSAATEQVDATGPYPIGRVGLAAAREAPSQDEAVTPENGHTVGTDAQLDSPVIPKESEHGDDAVPAQAQESEATEVANELADGSEPSSVPGSSTAGLGEAATRPELDDAPASPLSPKGPAPIAEVDSTEEVKQAGDEAVEEPETSRSNPFGRIGHPGAQSGQHGERELEQPNPDNAGAQSERSEIKWNENELRRDPAKTIASPDAQRQQQEQPGQDDSPAQG